MLLKFLSVNRVIKTDDLFMVVARVRSFGFSDQSGIAWNSLEQPGIPVLTRRAIGVFI
jgi:hypothetical protein